MLPGAVFGLSLETPCFQSDRPSRHPNQDHVATRTEQSVIVGRSVKISEYTAWMSCELVIITQLNDFIPHIRYLMSGRMLRKRFL